MNIKRHLSVRKAAIAVLILALLLSALSGCGKKAHHILIYSSAEDYVIEDLNQRLGEQFPDYDITLEYISTGDLAAKLTAEGTQTDCDIVQQLDYGYLDQLDQQGVLADLSVYDRSIYMDDTNVSENYIIQCRVGAAIIVNTQVLADKGLEVPTSYQDLLDPVYKDLISMPSPKASGTGYMFYKSMVNAWGEEATLAYFDKLTPNILQYTSSGSGPVNSLLQGEVAIGLGMTSQAVIQINEGAPFKILFFSEGSPYGLYGQTIIKGKETRPEVKEVFDYLVNTFNYIACENYYPEKIFKDKDYTTENYPQDIQYSSMSNNSIEEKIRLLDMWKY